MKEVKSTDKEILIMSHDQYRFDGQLAKKYGMEVAVFLDELAHWIKVNKANGRNIKDDKIWSEGTVEGWRCWSYNTVEAWAELFGFWTPRQMRTVIKNALQTGLIIRTKKYNDTKSDHRYWYAFSDEGLKVFPHLICPNGQKVDLTKRSKGRNDQTVNSIDNETASNASTNTAFICEKFKSKKQENKVSTGSIINPVDNLPATYKKKPGENYSDPTKQSTAYKPITAIIDTARIRELPAYKEAMRLSRKTKTGLKLDQK